MADCIDEQWDQEGKKKDLPYVSIMIFSLMQDFPLLCWFCAKCISCRLALSHWCGKNMGKLQEILLWRRVKSDMFNLIDTRLGIAIHSLNKIWKSVRLWEYIVILIVKCCSKRRKTVKIQSRIAKTQTETMAKDAQYLKLSVSRRPLIFWCDLIVWHMFSYKDVPDH